MSVWFEGSSEIECNIQQVKHAIEHLGEFFVGITGLMPGLAGVELVEQGSDFVIIRTNEGLMKRTNISKRIEAESVAVEFDEEYQAGSNITVKSRVSDDFMTSDTGIKHRTIISGVTASGLLGFFYRKFGKSSIGKALLRSYKTYFENQNP